MACKLVNKFPWLKVTVYNLPEACTLASLNVKEAQLENKIQIVEVNFLVDKKFPNGCDLVLFSRVLCDWSIDTGKALLLKAYEAIEKKGKVAICDAFHENNADFSLAWEFRYVFWDTFETEVFKNINDL